MHIFLYVLTLTVRIYSEHYWYGRLTNSTSQYY